MFQPQNLPRPNADAEDIERYIEYFKDDIADAVLPVIPPSKDDIKLPSLMGAASDAIRGLIIAPKGKQLYVADLSNIEGRVQAWLANETWKIQAFEDFDAGRGPDLYKMSYAKSFGIDPSEVTKEQRQKGKVQELAMAYAGGVGAYVTFALAYGFDLAKMAADAYPGLPPELIAEAIEFLEWMKKQRRSTHGLSEQVFITCDVFKRAWRLGHAATSAYWHELNSAAISAIYRPGVEIECGKVRFVRNKAWLRCILPSGRSLCYPRPEVDGKTISYEGQNQYTRKWQRLTTYGGKLFENICQAVACDVMRHAMVLMEERDYKITLTVHDEVIAEGDARNHSIDEFQALLSTPAPWAHGLPLAAAGYTDTRYHKD